MYWNYRVIDHGSEFEIVEAYYDDSGLFGYARARVIADTIEDLRSELECMALAFDRPPFKDSDLNKTEGDTNYDDPALD